MCDTLVRVLEGRVLFAKNSDREADEPQAIDLVPRRHHRPGSELRCTWIAIPQVETTWAVALSRPAWMWGAEMGTNEHGVTIGNEAVFTRGRVPAVGLTGMDLLRLALERATRASEAVRILIDLNERHGQGGRCGYEATGFRYFSSFLIADGREAFVLETAGRDSAVETVQGARSISNGLTIPGFAERHSDRVRTHVSACRIRRQRTERRAAAAATVTDLAAALRDHGSDGDDGIWPRYRFLNGAMDSPCMHAGGLLAASQTTASWIAELRPGAARHFVTATAAPCLSLFKPLGPLPTTPDEAAAATAMLGPAPGLSPAGDGSLWWQHERLHRLTMPAPARLAPLFLPERDRLERHFLDGRVSPETAWRSGREALSRWLDAVSEAASGEDVRPFFARRHWRRRRPVWE